MCRRLLPGKEMEESSATEDDEEEDITEHPELADLFQPAKKEEDEKWAFITISAMKQVYVFARPVTKGRAARPWETTEGNFLVPKHCRFENIVLFCKIGPIGWARHELINGQIETKFALQKDSAALASKKLPSDEMISFAPV